MPRYLRSEFDTSPLLKEKEKILKKQKEKSKKEKIKRERGKYGDTKLLIANAKRIVIGLIGLKGSRYSNPIFNYSINIDSVVAKFLAALMVVGFAKAMVGVVKGGTERERTTNSAGR